MLFPLIKIRETYPDGRTREHIVGTNSHDQLEIENGAIYYTNIQGMVGTMFPEESGMEFVPDKDASELCGYEVVEMVTLEELIEIATKNAIDQTEKSIKAHELYRKHLKTIKECEEKRREDDDIVDTSGRLF